MADTIAMDPAALRQLDSVLTGVAGGLPRHRRDGGSVADPAADAAMQDFQRRWGTQLAGLGQVVERAAQQARLTALAFELVDWR